MASLPSCGIKCQQAGDGVAASLFNAVSEHFAKSNRANSSKGGNSVDHSASTDSTAASKTSVDNALAPSFPGDQITIPN